MNPPAGFWRRYAAYSLDAAMLGLLSLPLLWPRLQEAQAGFTEEIARLQLRLWALLDPSLGSSADLLNLARDWAADPVLRASLASLSEQLASLLLAVALTVFVLAAAWFIASESSRWQASPGKRLLGLRVTHLTGGRCSPGRIALRFIAGIPSWGLLNLGHAMAGWRRDKRALHDLITGTRVELATGAPMAMPTWARSWLLLQAAALFGLLGFVLLRYAQLLWEVAAGGLP